ncbi:MAG: hypothetical protein ACRDOY_06815 [Nocardioidaceae bacterium]
MSTSRIKLLTEFAGPAFAIGGVATLGAGVLAAIAGQPTGWAVITALALGVPIALFGAGYAVLIATGKVPVGVFTPAAAFWAVGFPLSRLCQESVTELLFTGSLGLPQGPLWGFLVYQALLSMGFAIGYLWLHEQLGRYWWPRVRDHNPYASRSVEIHTQSAMAIRQRKEVTSQARQRKRQRAAQAREARAAARRT